MAGVGGEGEGVGGGGLMGVGWGSWEGFSGKSRIGKSISERP